MRSAINSLTVLLLTCSLTSIPAFAQGIDPLEINPRRSLIVTELSILQRFPLARTMNQLAAQTGIPGMTGEKIFRQWFDILNPAVEGATTGPHCDDLFDNLLGTGLLNSFPFTCRPATKESEGSEAFIANPMSGYVPITLTSRLDLAPGNGAHCGEYRIVYARSSGMTDDRVRNFLIFEAALPNPFPSLGLKGCKEAAKFWQRLSLEKNSKRRAELLEKFYYIGHAGFQPVINARHFGDNSGDFGQLRTNQFMQPRSQFASGVWTMREFKLKNIAGRENLIFPVTVKTNPFGPLFSSTGTHPLTAEFQNHFLTQIESLARPDFSFTYTVPDKFNTGQSQANGAENNYVTQLGGDLSPFGQRIQLELDRLQSALTPTQIVTRAQSVSCAGCHRLNANPTFSETQRSLGGGLVFPTSLDFTHSTERQKDLIDGEEAWSISPVLTSLLLPARQKILKDYLTDKLKHPLRPKDPIGGRPHH